MKYNLEKARETGQTDEEITNYLQSKIPEYSFQKQLDAGQSIDDIVEYMNGIGWTKPETTKAHSEPSSTPPVAQPSNTQELVPELAVAKSKTTSITFDTEIERQLYALRMTETPGGDPNAISPTKVTGAYQVTKGLARNLGFDPNSPDYNQEEVAKTHWLDLMDKYNSNGALAYGAYNAGEASINKARKLAKENNGDWIDYLNVPDNTAYHKMVRVANDTSLKYGGKPVTAEGKLKEVTGGIQRMSNHYGNTTLTTSKPTTSTTQAPTIDTPQAPVEEEKTLLDKAMPIISLLNPMALPFMVTKSALGATEGLTAKQKASVAGETALGVAQSGAGALQDAGTAIHTLNSEVKGIAPIVRDKDNVIKTIKDLIAHDKGAEGARGDKYFEYDSEGNPVGLTPSGITTVKDLNLPFKATEAVQSESKPKEDTRTKQYGYGTTKPTKSLQTSYYTNLPDKVVPTKSLLDIAVSVNKTGSLPQEMLDLYEADQEVIKESQRISKIANPADNRQEIFSEQVRMGKDIVNNSTPEIGNIVLGGMTSLTGSALTGAVLNDDKELIDNFMKEMDSLDELGTTTNSGLEGARKHVNSALNMVGYMGPSMATGAVTGGLGSAKIGYDTGFSEVYRELRRNGVDHESSKIISAEFAIPYMLLEYSQGASFGGLTPIKSIVKRYGAKGIANMAKKGTLRSTVGVVTNYVVDLGADATLNTIEEMLQKGTVELAVAKGTNTPVDPSKMMKSMTDEGVGVFGASLIMSAMGLTHGKLSYRRSLNAVANTSPELATKVETLRDELYSGEISEEQATERAVELGKEAEALGAEGESKQLESELQGVQYEGDEQLSPAQREVEEATEGAETLESIAEQIKINPDFASMLLEDYSPETQAEINALVTQQTTETEEALPNINLIDNGRTVTETVDKDGQVTQTTPESADTKSMEKPTSDGEPIVFTPVVSTGNLSDAGLWTIADVNADGTVSERDVDIDDISASAELLALNDDKGRLTIERVVASDLGKVMSTANIATMKKAISEGRGREAIGQLLREISYNIAMGDFVGSDLATKMSADAKTTSDEIYSPETTPTVATEGVEDMVGDTTAKNRYNEMYALLSEEDQYLADKISDEAKRTKFIENTVRKTFPSLLSKYQAEDIINDPDADKLMKVSAIFALEKGEGTNGAPDVDAVRGDVGKYIHEKDDWSANGKRVHEIIAEVEQEGGQVETPTSVTESVELETPADVVESGAVVQEQMQEAMADLENDDSDFANENRANVKQALTALAPYNGSKAPTTVGQMLRPASIENNPMVTALTNDAVAKTTNLASDIFATAHLQKNKIPYVRMMGDLRNLGGLNEFFAGKLPDSDGNYFNEEWVKSHPEFADKATGKPMGGHDATNVLYGMIWDKINATANTDESQTSRIGGDELTGIYAGGATKAEVSALMEKAIGDVDGLIGEYGLQELPHPKNNHIPVGVGIDWSLVEVGPNTNGFEARKDGDAIVEVKKKAFMEGKIKEIVDTDGNPVYFIDETGGVKTVESARASDKGVVADKLYKGEITPEQFKKEMEDVNSKTYGAVEEELQGDSTGKEKESKDDRVPANDEEDGDRLKGTGIDVGQDETKGKKDTKSDKKEETTKKPVVAKETKPTQESKPVEEVSTKKDSVRDADAVDAPRTTGKDGTEDGIVRGDIVYQRWTNDFFYPVGKVSADDTITWFKGGSGRGSAKFKAKQKFGAIPLSAIEDGENVSLKVLRKAQSIGKEVVELTPEDIERKGSKVTAKRKFVESIGEQTLTEEQYKEQLADFKKEQGIKDKTFGRVSYVRSDGSLTDNNADFIVEAGVVMSNTGKRKSQEVEYKDYQQKNIVAGEAGSDGDLDVMEDTAIEIAEETTEDREEEQRTTRADKLLEERTAGIDKAVVLVERMRNSKTPEAKKKYSGDINTALKLLAKKEIELGSDKSSKELVREYTDEVKTIFNSNARSKAKKAVVVDKSGKGGLDYKTAVNTLKELFPIAKNVDVTIEALPDGVGAEVLYIGDKAMVWIDGNLTDVNAVNTIMHEIIGHYGIDQLIANDPEMITKVDALYDSIKDTAYGDKIRKLYPNLKGKALKQEMIANAIGDSAHIALNKDGTKKDSFVKLDSTNPLVKAYQLVKQFFHRLFSGFKNIDANRRDKMVNKLLVAMRKDFKPSAIGRQGLFSKTKGYAEQLNDDYMVALENNNEDKAEALFEEFVILASVPYTKESYSKSPDALLGFTKDTMRQSDTNGYKTKVVYVVKEVDGTFTIGEEKGLNIPHAMERARRNHSVREYEKSIRIVEGLESYLSVELDTNANPKTLFERMPDKTSTGIAQSTNKEAHSISSKHAEAVASGDMKTAQKLVDDFASLAGYTVRAYHGTSNKDFTKFDKNKIGSKTDEGWAGHGFYFDTDKGTAEAYGKNVIKGALKLENPFNFKGKNFATILEEHGGPKGFSSWLRKNGYDGSILWNQRMVLDANQIKSAEAVTYDDNGNLIPLTERFDAGKEDIRYSRTEDSKHVKEGSDTEAPVKKKKPRKISIRSIDSIYAKGDLEATKTALTKFVQQRVLTAEDKVAMWREIEGIKTLDDYAKFRASIDGKVDASDQKVAQRVNKKNAKTFNKFNATSDDAKEFASNTAIIDDVNSKPGDVVEATERNNELTYKATISNTIIVDGKKKNLEKLAGDVDKLMQKNKRFQNKLLKDNDFNPDLKSKIEKAQFDLMQGVKALQEQTMMSIPYMMNIITRGKKNTPLHEVFVTAFQNAANDKALLEKTSTNYMLDVLAKAGLITANSKGKMKFTGLNKFSRAVKGDVVERTGASILKKSAETQDVKVTSVQNVGGKNQNEKAISIPLTKGQKVSILLSARNDNSRAQLTHGGITLSRNSSNRYIFSEETLANLEKSLSKEEQVIYDAMVEWFNDPKHIKDKLNEASRNLTGTNVFTQDDYFPQMSVQGQHSVDAVNDGDGISLMQQWLTSAGPQHASITKDRTATQDNPIILRDVFEVWEAHTQMANKYIAFAQPIDNARKVQKKIGGFGTYGYKGVDKLLTNAIDTTAGVVNRSTMSKIMRYFRGGLASNVLGANIITALKQTPSVMLSWNQLSPKGVAKTIAKVPFIGNKKLQAEVEEIAPFIRDRYISMGKTYFGETGTEAKLRHRIKGRTGWGEVAMIPMTTMDKEAILRIYTGVKQTAKDKGLTGEEATKFIKETFTNIVMTTQPDNNAFAKAGLQLSQNEIVKSLGMFATQRMKIAQMSIQSFHEAMWGVEDALEGIKTKDMSKVTEGRKQVQKAMRDFTIQTVATASTMALINSWSAFAKALAKGEEPDEFNETYFKEFAKSIMGNYIIIGDMVDVVVAEFDKYYLDGSMDWKTYDKEVSGWVDMLGTLGVIKDLTLYQMKTKNMTHKEKKRFNKTLDSRMRRYGGTAIGKPVQGTYSSIQFILGVIKSMED